ncbi:MAG: hypothetical protein LAP40_19890 [Acidobacteriia bacterium]|nr:hypothetical protein [Terriglobia bacterium]
MAEPEPPNVSVPETASGPGRSPDEVALELMKFVAVTTGYGRASQSAAGFSGKPVARSIEEHTEALLDLFERCRRVVKKEA